MRRRRILVFGATGLFGDLLVRRLARDSRLAVIGAARGRGALMTLQSETDVTTEVVDRDDVDAVAEVLGRQKPFVVVDCAGPFQYYGERPYRFARQVLQAGCHYIDIADASSFVICISELDALAKQKSLVAIAGASTAPAISAAATDQLVGSLRQIVSIESTIVPGNRARRTYSVMKAILGQIGQEYAITRYARQTVVYGWGETREICLSLPEDKPMQNRLASLVHTPEVELFPERYQAQTVATYAGLELRFFHRALQLGGMLVRLGLISSLAPLTGLLRWIASWFESFGSDIGGMQVTVIAEREASAFVQRSWDLVADDGRGPEIPTLPVSVLIEKLLHDAVAVGARPGCGEVSLDDLKPYFDAIDAKTAITEEELQPVFKSVLNESFDQLPLPVQGLHSTIGRAVYSGQAQSMGATGFSGKLAAWLFRFPGKAKDVPVEVTINAGKNSEVWQRNFAGKEFRSCLALHPAGYLTERFGPLTMRLDVYQQDGRLYFPVGSAKLFGKIALPGFLLPRSIAHESVDTDGRFTFDVNLSTPFGARIAHYRGWLVRLE